MAEFPLPEGRLEWREGVVVDDLGEHRLKAAAPARKINDSVLETFDQTPLVRLSRLAKARGVQCELYAKCEFLSGGGSPEDRMATRMVELAEESGRLKEGMTIVEPNAGSASMAMVAANRGYKYKAFVPSDLNVQRLDLLKTLGADVTQVDKDIPVQKWDSFVGQAVKFTQANPNTFLAFAPRSYAGAVFAFESAASLFEPLEKRVDLIVGSSGAGHTIHGLSKAAKAAGIRCRVIAARVDKPNSIESLAVELDGDSVDQIITIKDELAFQTARDLHTSEGILCGLRSGRAMAAALEAASTLTVGQRCVVILPDEFRSIVASGFDIPPNEPAVNIPPANPDLPVGNDTIIECPFQCIRLPWVTTKMERKPICDSILDAIGNSPMIRLRKIPISQGINVNIYAKCEFLNPGGSVKDRIALEMVERAENLGYLKSGMTIVEPSSGNTGIGLALVAAVKGYSCIVVMSDKQCADKEQTLRALGARVVRTKHTLDAADPDSVHSVAARIHDANAQSIILDQYRNDANPLAHYRGTGVEIMDACEEGVEAMVIGAGTGGTLSGVAKRVRDELPNCMIYGVDPVGSILSSVSDAKPGKYLVEGIGQDFVPPVLNNKILDGWIRVKDSDAFKMARQVLKEEGILCGGSSGANVWAALEIARKMGAESKVVTILPDGVRNSMHTWVSERWLAEHGVAD